MNAIVTWNDPQKTILMVQITCEWNLDNLQQTAHTIREHINSVDHDVDVIVDARELCFRQTNLISRFTDLDRGRVNNRRYVTIIGLNPYLKTLLRVAGIFAPKTLSNVHFVDSYVEVGNIVRRTLTMPIIA